LAAFTREVAADGQLRARLAASAAGRAGAFSEEAFAARWRQIATDLDIG
jgi:hypothetical protein